MCIRDSLRVGRQGEDQGVLTRAGTHDEDDHEPTLSTGRGGRLERPEGERRAARRDG